MFCKCILVYLSLYLHCNFYINIDNIDDIKAVIKVLKDTIQRNYSNLSDATEGCLKKIAEQMYCKGLVSKAVQTSPTFDSVMSQFEVTLQISNSIQQIEEKCNQFVQSLSCQGGPAQAAVKNLVEQWKDNINRQFNGLSFINEETESDTTFTLVVTEKSMNYFTN